LGGFVADLRLVVFGDEELLLEGLDCDGGVVGCCCRCEWGWGFRWTSIAVLRAVAVVGAVWLLGVASAVGA
jgi:hypothetical protein